MTGTGRGGTSYHLFHPNGIGPTHPIGLDVHHGPAVGIPHGQDGVGVREGLGPHVADLLPGGPVERHGEVAPVLSKDRHTVLPVLDDPARGEVGVVAVPPEVGQLDLLVGLVGAALDGVGVRPLLVEGGGCAAARPGGGEGPTFPRWIAEDEEG